MHEALSTLARHPGDLLDHVISCDADGIPTLSALAPDMCENEPLTRLNAGDQVTIFDRSGEEFCKSRAAWAAREVAAGRLVRTSVRGFART